MLEKDSQGEDATIGANVVPTRSESLQTQDINLTFDPCATNA